MIVADACLAPNLNSSFIVAVAKGDNGQPAQRQAVREAGTRGKGQRDEQNWPRAEQALGVGFHLRPANVDRLGQIAQNVRHYT